MITNDHHKQVNNTNRNNHKITIAYTLSVVHSGNYQGTFSTHHMCGVVKRHVLAHPQLHISQEVPQVERRESEDVRKLVIVEDDIPEGGERLAREYLHKRKQVEFVLVPLAH